MPAGMMLYQPILAGESSNLEAPSYYGGNEEELCVCVLQLTPTNLQAAIDG